MRFERKYADKRTDSLYPRFSCKKLLTSAAHPKIIFFSLSPFSLPQNNNFKIQLGGIFGPENASDSCKFRWISVKRNLKIETVRDNLV